MNVFEVLNCFSRPKKNTLRLVYKKENKKNVKSPSLNKNSSYLFTQYNFIRDSLVNRV